MSTFSVRRNWRNFGNNEYDLDDDSNMIGLDDEDPRGEFASQGFVRLLRRYCGLEEKGKMELARFFL